MNKTDWKSKAAFDEIKRRVTKFVLSLRKDNTFEFYLSNESDTTIAIASATAVSLLAFLGKLDGFSVSEKSEWISYLSSFQRSDGLFEDTIDCKEQTQPQPYWALLAHRSRHVAWAIEALGGKIPNRIAFVSKYYEKDVLTRELESLWNSNPFGGIWALGNWIMDIGVLLDLQYRHFGEQKALTAINNIFDFLDGKQDKKTGYWFLVGDCYRTAMAGSMHLYPLYWAYGRNVNFFDKAVEFTLKLQQPDGLFSFESGEGGSQCLDYDALLILANGKYLCPEYSELIAKACEKVLDSIFVNFTEDGSFADCQKDELRFWATKSAASKANKGGLWDTYARLMSVVMCHLVLYGYVPSTIKCNHNIFEIFHGGGNWQKGEFCHLVSVVE